MIGVPGTSEPARTSSMSPDSTLSSVKVPATAGVSCHWARSEVQSADQSMAKAGAPNTVVPSARLKQPFCPLKTKRPGPGAWQGVSLGGAPPLPPWATTSSLTTAAMGEVPQPSASKAPITPQGEDCSESGANGSVAKDGVIFWTEDTDERWREQAPIMSFASVAPVAIVVPSSFAAPLAERGAELLLELHSAILRNDAGWQRRAFNAFHDLVHGLLIKTLGPRAEIADLVGDVFVSFFANAQRIQNAQAVRSYLVSITMNLARRELRQRKRRDLFQRFTGATQDYEQEAGPDDPRAKAALIQLSRILDELSADDRAAFVLSNLEGMPALEVGRVLGVSESTAKRRVRRANERVLKRVRCNVLLADYVQVRRERGNG
jgi:RNA polymerase sigma factor (sigma-70 family)